MPMCKSGKDTPIVCQRSQQDMNVEDLVGRKEYIERAGGQAFWNTVRAEWISRVSQCNPQPRGACRRSDLL